MIAARDSCAFYAVLMRSRYETRMLVGLSILAAVVFASGCAAKPALDPVPALPGPAFASDEEALAAAEEIVREYVSLTDEVAAQGGVGIEVLKSVTTTEHHQMLRDGYAEYHANGLSRTGTVRLSEVELQQHFSDDSHAHVLVYFCLDYSDTRLLSEALGDVTPDYFSEPALFEAELRAQKPGPFNLRLHSSELRESGSACAD